MIDSAQAAAGNRQLKRDLRRTLRRARKAIDPQARRIADQRICTNIAALPAWRRAHDIATFLAFDGEPSLAALHTQRYSDDKRFYVPVIRARGMRFAPLTSQAGMRRNSFGIREPRHRFRFETRRLDIVLVSLVGFDLNGNRLGMGGGFYDRHFSFLKTRLRYIRPRLIGVAYSLQQVPQLPKDPWDVPLWGIVTENGFLKI